MVTVSNPHNVYQTVARHIGHVDGVLCVRGYPNGAIACIQKLQDRGRISVAIFTERRELIKDLVYGDKYIRQPIACQIHKIDPLSRRIDVRKLVEHAEWHPAIQLR